MHTKLDKTLLFPALARLAGPVVALAVLEQDAVAVLLLEGVIVAVLGLEHAAGEGALGQ